MRSEKGFSLVEVLVAIMLLGIVGLAYLTGVLTASKAIVIADERATAESLARTEMEYVRSQDYSEAPWNYTVTSSDRSSTDPPTWYDAEGNPPLLDSSYDSYSVSVSAEGLLNPSIDNWIQMVTVVVSHLEKPEVVKLEGYWSMQ